VNFRVVIPARYGSGRLPGKPLIPLAGRPLIRHVCARAFESLASEVWVATDDERIAAACEGLGVQVAMTSSAHASGTDRIAELAARSGWRETEIVVNLQGDEPLMPPAAINLVAETLAADPDAAMATLACRLRQEQAFHDPHVVKLVTDRAGYALYFSRAPIPWPREAGADLPPEILRHVGLYAYRAGTLEQIATEPVCALERAEGLEQLRALWLGLRIRVAVGIQVPSIAIDTPEDLPRAEVLLREREPGKTPG